MRVLLSFRCSFWHTKFIRQEKLIIVMTMGLFLLYFLPDLIEMQVAASSATSLFRSLQNSRVVLSIYQHLWYFHCCNHRFLRIWWLRSIQLLPRRRMTSDFMSDISCYALQPLQRFSMIQFQEQKSFFYYFNVNPVTWFKISYFSCSSQV